MILFDDTTQAHDVAVRADDAADGPVKVDTAMRRCAAMYLGAGGRDLATLRRTAPTTLGRRDWWRKVEAHI